MEGFQKHVIFLGNRNDVDKLYQAMDVCVRPAARDEGLPVVGVEAQAAGLPCIRSDRMTKKVKMTDDAVFLNIDNGPCEWADAIQRGVNCRLTGMKRRCIFH